MLLSELFLKEYEKINKNKPLLVPLGTLEWHGNHLPLGTDMFVAYELCKRTGYFYLPPVFLGSDRSKKVGNKLLVGMDRKTGKINPGSIYFLNQHSFFSMVKGILNNLKKQNFRKIVFITGHCGGGQIKVLNKCVLYAKKECMKLLVINPYDIIKKKYSRAGHAGIFETSLFWSLRPDLIKKSQKQPQNKDLNKLCGTDPRKKASKQLGEGILKAVLVEIKKQIKSF